MILRKSVLTKSHVTLRTHKIWVFLSAVDLEIQRATFIGRGGDVTAVGAATRSYRNFLSLLIEGTEARHRDVVAIQATQVRMLAALMTKRAR